MLSSFGCVSSPSGPNASSSKKHHVVDPLSRNSPVRRALLLVRGEHRAGLARFPGLDDVDRPLAQACAGRRRRRNRGRRGTRRDGRRPPDPDRARRDRTRLARAVSGGSLRDVDLTVLGSTVRHPIDHVEVFPAPANVTIVRFTNDELTSMCPVTQQPDLSTVVIEYVPAEWCVESKSLKLYLWGFRDRAVFAEALAAEIAGEIMTTAQPSAASRVPLTQRPRGGIEVQAVAELHRADGRMHRRWSSVHLRRTHRPRQHCIPSASCLGGSLHSLEPRNAFLRRRAESLGADRHGDQGDDVRRDERRAGCWARRRRRTPRT